MAEGSNDLANSLFGTYLNVDTRLASPKLVCFYAGKPSEHLQMDENPDVRFKGDIFNLSRAADNPLLEKLIDKKNWSTTNKVVGFNVDFGNRNQSMFHGIQLDQVSFAATTEANQQLTEMTNAAGGRKSFVQSVSLYNLYKNRSYECTVESLGNVMIQPTMYFNLRHVPMFNGPYMIQSVTHDVSPGQFRTTFKGVRMPVYSLPKITEQIASINQNILSDLILEVRRRRQTDQTNGTASVNVTSVGNGINSGQKYQVEPSSTCFNSLSPTYQRYVGTDGVPTQLSYNQAAEIISKYTEDTRVRACVFYTMYLNGNKDEQFIANNYNYGGAIAGGYLNKNIKYGGSLNNYFNNNYFCMRDSNGDIKPFLDFVSAEKHINFLVDFYKNRVQQFQSEWNLGTVRYQNYPSVLSSMYITYWPEDRFKSDAEKDSWIKSNSSQFKILEEKAAETVELCKKVGLL